MQILSIRPAPPGTGRTIALFDIALTDELRVYDVRLIQTEDGRYLSYAPNSHGRRVATFAPRLANEISRVASTALREGIAQNGTTAEVA
jgi:DNA-binding cell septation regulator SpoVG